MTKPPQISEARLREIVRDVAPGTPDTEALVEVFGRSQAYDLITALRWALQPEPGCDCPGLAGVRYGPSHYDGCPITAHRNHRAAMLRVIEEEGK